MVKKITLFLALFVGAITFSQEQDGNRAGTIFYGAIEKTDDNFSIYVDLFEPQMTKYIEAELYDDNDVKLSSVLVKVFKEEKNYYTYNEEKDVKTKVIPQDINLLLDKPTADIDYPKIRIKLLNENFGVIDFSQKIFY